MSSRTFTYAACSVLAGSALLSCTAELTGEGAGDGGGQLGESGDNLGKNGTDGQEECGETQPRPITKLLRVSNFEYRNMVEDLLGTKLEEEVFLNWTPIAEVYGFDTMSETRIDARALDEQLRSVEAISEIAVRTQGLVSHCPQLPEAVVAPDLPPLSYENCAQGFIENLGSRAFRRPLRADEVSGYAELFADSESRAAGAGLAHPVFEGLLATAQAILLSPHVTFKPELVPGGFDLGESDFANASRISLFLRSSIPDEELRGLAEQGFLDTPAAIETQARRLLEKDQARFLRHFGGQWLDFRDKVGPDEPLLAAMKDEVEHVFAEVLAQDLGPEALLTPGFTFVDQTLAEHYGLPFDGALGSPQKVRTDERGGLVFQGFFLKRTATGSDFRRAIHRGLWVLTRLLCREMPRLDAATVEEIATSFDAIDRTLPLASQMEIHRTASPRCLGCHGEIDPIGLALENYDAEGLWREVDQNGHLIESDLELLGQLVDSPLALAQTIGSSADYRSCVSTKALTFALNRGPTNAEECLAGELSQDAEGNPLPLTEVAISALLASFELVENAQ